VRNRCLPPSISEVKVPSCSMLVSTEKYLMKAAKLTIYRLTADSRKRMGTRKGYWYWFICHPASTIYNRQQTIQQWYGSRTYSIRI
jgi:hypothetical protein